MAQISQISQISRISSKDFLSNHFLNSAAFRVWVMEVSQACAAGDVSEADLQASAPLTDEECEDIIEAFDSDPNGDGNDMPNGVRPDSPIGYDYSQCNSIEEMREVVLRDCMDRALERMYPFSAWLAFEK